MLGLALLAVVIGLGFVVWSYVAYAAMPLGSSLLVLVLVPSSGWRPRRYPASSQDGRLAVELWSPVLAEEVPSRHGARMDGAEDGGGCGCVSWCLLLQ